MGLMDILKGLTNHSDEIDLKVLPSQGLFYKKDFTLKIKKASIEDIKEYETNISNSLYSMITEIKNIVMKNTILSDNYTYLDIKSVDIIYLFFEIVKMTNNSPINISYIDNIGNINELEISPDTYNYFDFSKYMKYYNEDDYAFIIDGYKFSPPSFGVEDSLTNFLISKSEEEELYNSYSYDFRFFLGMKDKLSFDEIDNLIIIFNQDIKQGEQLDIKRIVSKFEPLASFTLKKDGKVVDIQSKLDLINIWK